MPFESDFFTRLLNALAKELKEWDGGDPEVDYTIFAAELIKVIENTLED